MLLIAVLLALLPRVQSVFSCFSAPKEKIDDQLIAIHARFVSKDGKSASCGRVEYEMENIKTMFKISNAIPNQIVVRITRPSNESVACMAGTIIPSMRKGILNQINGGATEGCPSGRGLVRVFVQFARVIGMRRVELTDASVFPCRVVGGGVVYVGSRVKKVFMKEVVDVGWGYYNELGFRVSSKEQVMIREAAGFLASVSINQVMQESYLPDLHLGTTQDTLHSTLHSTLIHMFIHNNTAFEQTIALLFNKNTFKQLYHKHSTLSQAISTLSHSREMQTCL